jgi:hypothetical protein
VVRAIQKRRLAKHDRVLAMASAAA